VNVLIYLLQLMLSERGQDAFLIGFGLVPAYFSLLNVLTSMFVHGGLAHLGGNMLFLWIFGDNVEDRMGHGRFIAFYLMCGFAAAIAQTALNPNSLVPMVGASGAIAGVMGAYLVLYPHSRVLMLFPFPVFLFELPAVVFLVIWFLVQFLNGINQLPIFEHNAISGGVAFWAHVIGFVAGLILVVFMKRPERTKVEWWDTIGSQRSDL
jgi:membrane associated rhomboid family serine protease